MQLVKRLAELPIDALELTHIASHYVPLSADRSAGIANDVEYAAGRVRHSAANPPSATNSSVLSTDRRILVPI